MRKRLVRDIVQDRPLYVVQKDDSVLNAVRYMTEYRIGAVPIVDGERLLGILSERDVMNRVVAQELDPAATQVSQVMTKKLAVLAKDSTSEDALAVMGQLHVRHLPVMAEEQLLGCVSIRELQIMELEAQEVEIEYLDDHIRNVVGW